MKALALFSGGLDSILSVWLIKKQRIEVEGVCFISPFFSSKKAQMVAQNLKMPLLVMDIGRELLSLIKSPPHGFGKGANPCIDCHILMVKTAGNLMKERGASFLISGEVLGERPKSQSRRALNLVAKESGWGEYLLRPLTAKNLPPTLPEREGWVDREKLLGIKGRSRGPQLELAKKFGIEEFPPPAGGCLLTDPNFSRRIKYVLRMGRLNMKEVELLKIGRHFHLNHRARVVVGRNREENLKIEKLATPGDFILKVKGGPGPTTLLFGAVDEELIYRAASLAARYSDVSGEVVEVEYHQVPGGESKKIKVTPMDDTWIEKLRIEEVR
jgi:tRNA U34 2-thiouridine synthase MnmA/TrmU